MTPITTQMACSRATLARTSGFGSGHVNRVFPVAAELRAALGGTRTDARTEVRAFGIAADERLREQRQPGAARGRLGHQTLRLLHAGSRIEEHGTGLHHRHSVELMGVV